MLEDELVPQRRQFSLEQFILLPEDIILLFIDHAELLLLHSQRPVLELEVVLHCLISSEQRFVVG